MTKLFTIALLAILATDCGSRRDEGARYTPTASTQQLIDRLVDARCTASVRCGESPDTVYCRDYLFGTGYMNFDTLANAIDQGRVVRNPSEETACFDAVANRPCLQGSSFCDSVMATCRGALIGTIAAGGDCVDGFECGPGLECDTGSCAYSCCVGVCAPPKLPAAVGESCADSSCVATAYCKETPVPATRTTDKTCQERVPLGAACATRGSCVTGSECVGTTASKTCVALPKDGDPCSPDGAICESTASYCDALMGTCQPLLKENAACVLPDTHPTAPYTAGCYLLNECKNGVCSRLPLTGQPCSNPDPVAIDECFLVGKCVGGFCRADPPRPLCTVASAKAAGGGY